VKTELTNGDKHLMRLMHRDKNTDGWTKVSQQVWPLVERLPKELVELHPEGGFAKLTEAGETIVLWT
jgi:hypothetical protein